MAAQKFKITTHPCGVQDTNGKKIVRNCTYVSGVQLSSSFNGVLEIPDNVEMISKDAFWGKTKISKVIIPPSVINIFSLAFGECSQLEEVQFPEGAHPINLHKDTFLRCNKLSNLHVSQNTVIHGNLGTCLDSISGLGKDYYTDGVALYDSSKRNLIWAFGKVSEYSIPKGVQNISESAFANNEFIKKVSLPETISCIDSFAFINCSSLQQIIIPKSVIKIGMDCFKDCTSLKTIAFDAEEIEFSGGVFSGCSSLKTFTLPKKCKIIPCGCFENCSSLEIDGLSIPEGIKAIGRDAFYGCAFKSVCFPKSLELIEDDSFSGCKELKSIIIPDSVKTVGCFQFCRNLTEVSVKSPDIITEDAFNENVKIVVRS